MNHTCRSIRRAVGAALFLLAAGASPAWAHGGHDAALDTSPALHVLAHLFGSPVAWAVVAVGVLVLLRLRSGDAGAKAARAGEADDDQV